MLLLRGSFSIRTAEGAEITVNEYVEVLDSSSLNSSDAMIDGLNLLVTVEGDNVTELEDGTFHIIVTGQTGTRVHDGAPRLPR